MLNIVVVMHLSIFLGVLELVCLHLVLLGCFRIRNVKLFLVLLAHHDCVRILPDSCGWGLWGSQITARDSLRYRGHLFKTYIMLLLLFETVESGSRTFHGGLLLYGHIFHIFL